MDLDEEEDVALPALGPHDSRRQGHAVFGCMTGAGALSSLVLTQTAVRPYGLSRGGRRIAAPLALLQ